MLGTLVPAHALCVAGEAELRLALSEDGRGAVVGSVAHVRVLEGLLDLEAGDGERADHLEGEEANNVDGVVAGLEVKRGREVEELLEALRFAVREGGLSAVRIVLVLFARHLTSCVVCFLGVVSERK